MFPKLLISEVLIQDATGNTAFSSEYNAGMVSY
jgi:hypothetical protein